jgi:protein-tyrosine-phosphatase
MQYSVVRPGVIDERILHRMADLTILFLCTGNTCRSPMAAALAGRMLADKLKITPGELPLRHIVVQSAGLHASRGLRATMEAMEAVKALGGDLTTHISQSATPDILRRADVIYTMTDAHREEVLDLYPWAERKTVRLDPEGDIADPIGATLAVYQRVARRLASVLQERLDELVV